MDIRADKNWIKARLDHVNDPTVIRYLKNFLLEKEREAEARAMFQEGLNDVEKGNILSTEELRGEVSSWKSKA